MLLRRNGYLVKHLIGVFLICSAITIPGRVFCYDTNAAHPKIAEMAIELFNENSSQKLTDQEKSWIMQGAIEEDTPTRWLNHFYDPVYNRGIWFGKQQLSAKDWAQNPQAQTNFALGDKTWQRALDDYRKGNKEKTFRALGHIIHLVSDMTVPAHTRDDIHIIGDSYEHFLKNNWSSVSGLLKSNFTQINDLNSIFDALAKYSNNNFYSDDTIESERYHPIDILDQKEFIYKDNYYFYNYSVENEGKKYRIFISKKERNWRENIGEQKTKYLNPFNDGGVLIDYSTHLLPKAVGSSAGVIKLFLKEVNATDFQSTDKTDSKLPILRTGIKGYADRVAGAVISGASDAWNYLKGKFGAKSEPTYGSQTQEIASAPTVLNIPNIENAPDVQNVASVPVVPDVTDEEQVPNVVNDASDEGETDILLTETPLPAAPVKNPVIITAPGPKISPAPAPIVYSYGGGGGGGGNYSGGDGGGNNTTENNNAADSSTATTPSAPASTSTPTSTPTISDTTPPEQPIINAQFLNDIYTTSSARSVFGTNSTDTAKVLAYQTNTSSADVLPLFEQTASGTDFSFSFGLNPGHNYIYFSAIDSAGNTSTFSNTAHLVLDYAPPPIPVLTVLDQSGIASTNIHITLSCLDELSPMTYYDISYADASASSTWTELAAHSTSTEFDFTGERGKSYLFKARAVDSLGNASDWAGESGVSVDWSKEVVINEVAWAGTSAQYPADEWLELYNNTDSAINLRYWKVFVSGRQINWTTSTVQNSVIPAYGYFLLERTKDDKISDIPANIIYTLDNGLKNSGEKIELFNPAGIKIDEVECSNGWFAGNNIDYRSMERINPLKPGNLASNWQSSLGLRMLGRSYAGGNLNGSPKQPNFGFLELRNTQQEARLVLSPENNPYVLSDYTVPTGKDLLIEPGVVIKSPYKGSKLNIYGTLSVNGAVDALVVFTSGRDQSFSNDLLDTVVGTWASASPAPADWIGIWLYSNSSSTITNAQIRYAGYPERPPGGNVWTLSVANAMRAENSTVNISDSLFQNNGGTTFYLYNSTSTISNAAFAGGTRAIDSWNGAFALSDSSFADFTDAQGPVVVHNTWPSFEDISFASNTLNRIYLSRMTISAESARITKEMSLSCYFGSLGVGPSSTLNIDPGAEVRLASYAGIEVRGALNSLGTADEQVLFRPLKDDSGWGQIIFRNSSSTIQNTRFWRGNRTYTSTWDTDGMLFAVNSNLLLDNVYLEDARRPGNSLQASNSFVTVRNSHIQDVAKYTSYGSSVGRGVMARGGKVIFDNDYFSRLQIGITADSASVLEFISMLSQNFEDVDYPVDWSGWKGFATSTPQNLFDIKNTDDKIVLF